MVYLILGVICVVTMAVAGAVLLVRHRAARRKVTVFLNGEEIPEPDWHMAPDRVPVFHFPVRQDSECILVRGDGTRTVAPMIRVRMQLTRNRAVEPFVRLDPPQVTGVDANAVARQVSEALREPDYAFTSPAAPGVTVTHVTVETRSAANQEPPPPRFERDLDIKE